MFSTEDFKWLDPKYFNIITVNDYDVTVMSRNTGHYWYIHDPDCPGEDIVVLFHRHHGGSEPYHYQRRESSMRTAVRYIRKHDRFQMNGRKW